MTAGDDESISVTAEPFPGGMRFVITGAMDLANAAPVVRLLRDATRDLDVDVVVDLSPLTVLDSRGVAELHGLHRDLTNAGRTLRMTAAPGTVAGQVLRLTGLDAVWGGTGTGATRVVGPRRPPG